MEHNNREEAGVLRSSWERAVAGYDVAWPDHCQVCDGWGIIFPEPQMGPSGQCSLVFRPTVCPSCYGQARCPRCQADNAEAWGERDQPCRVCGWTGLSGGRPDRPEERGALP